LAVNDEVDFLGESIKLDSSFEGTMILAAEVMQNNDSLIRKE
jgi:hypothetical protein